MKLPASPGIYAIVNKSNRRLYIGKSYNIRSRVQQHIYAFKHGKHTKKMQTDYNIDPEAFEYRVLFLCNNSKRELDGLEAIAIGYFWEKLGSDLMYNTFEQTSRFGTILLMHSNKT